MDQPSYIEPSFDLRSLHKLLMNDGVSTKEKIAGLLGLHIKFWHASHSDMHRMLYRAGLGKEVLDLLKPALDRCPECRAMKATLTKPLVRIRSAEYFNERVQTDLFFLWAPSRCYIILIDECIRYCLAAPLERRTAQ